MRRAVIGVAVMAVLAAVVVIWQLNRSPNQGWDTTCGDFLQMSPRQQTEVMHKGGVTSPPEHVEAQAKFYVWSCAPHPEDKDNKLGDIAH